MDNSWIAEQSIMRKTILLDIDGCLFRNGGEDTIGIAVNLMENKQQILDGVKEKIQEWRDKNYHIVITTGRPYTLQGLTEQQLLRHGILYDDIVMGCNQERHVINDLNSKGQQTAHAHNLERNAGLTNVEI